MKKTTVVGSMGVIAAALLLAWVWSGPRSANSSSRQAVTLQEELPIETFAPPNVSMYRALLIAEASVANIRPEMNLADIVARNITWSEFLALSGHQFTSWSLGISHGSHVWLVAFKVIGDLERSSYLPPLDPQSAEDLARQYPSPTPGGMAIQTAGYMVIEVETGQVILTSNFPEWDTEFTYQAVADLPGGETPTPILVIEPAETPGSIATATP